MGGDEGRISLRFQAFVDLMREDDPPDTEEWLEEQRPHLAEMEWEELASRARDHVELAMRITAIPQLFRPGRRLEQFELLRSIGMGAVGWVWEAFDHHLDRHVALKILLPRHALSSTAVMRFRREAKACARLSHSGIVRVLHLLDIEAQMVMVQDLVPEGRTLAHWIAGKAWRSRPCMARVEVLLKVADALAYAHREGVIHRDVKPSNILMAKEDQPLLADFGLSLVLDTTRVTRSDERLGTVPYMSPEHVAGAAIEAPSDQFSLGVVLYELLTRQLPFRGASEHQICQRIANEEPLAPHRVDSTIPAEISLVCMKALRKEPRERYPTVDAFRDDLARFVAGEQVGARPPSWGSRWRSLRRSYPRLQVVVLAALVSGITVAAAFVEVLKLREIVQVERDRAHHLLASMTVNDLLSEAEQLPPPLPVHRPVLANWASRAAAAMADLEDDAESGRLGLRNELRLLIGEFSADGADAAFFISDEHQKRGVLERLNEHRVSMKRLQELRWSSLRFLILWSVSMRRSCSPRPGCWWDRSAVLAMKAWV